MRQLRRLALIRAKIALNAARGNCVSGALADFATQDMGCISRPSPINTPQNLKNLWRRDFSHRARSLPRDRVLIHPGKSLEVLAFHYGTSFVLQPLQADDFKRIGCTPFYGPLLGFALLARITPLVQLTCGPDRAALGHFSAPPLDKLQGRAFCTYRKPII